jgi:ribosomal protein S6--L-glutamate ligase
MSGNVLLSVGTALLRFRGGPTVTDRMRILVLSRNASLYSTSRIVLAARARGHLVAVVDPLDFQIVVSRGRPSLVLGTEEVHGIDLVIPRIGASITTYGLAVVRQLDMMRIPVLNSAVAIARSRDKLRAFQLLTRRNIDVPTTVCARNPATIAGAVERVGGTPAIVKIQQGTQGIGTMIAETPQAVSSLLETLWAMGQDIVLQEYIRESKGRDVRTIVVGGRVVASMRRQAKDGEFRSNLHRGGTAERVELPASYRAAAVAATRAMGLEVAGVDMLEGSDGPKILEINSSPGLEGIERSSGVDVATAIVKHAERFVAKRHGHSSKRDLDSRIDAVEVDERGPARRPRTTSAPATKASRAKPKAAPKASPAAAKKAVASKAAAKPKAGGSR